MEDYVGKKLSECPDGTVALVCYPALDTLLLRVVDGGRAYRLGNGWRRGALDSACLSWPVHTIIKLGNPKPRTLADEDPGVAWRNPGGALLWRDAGGSLIVCPPGGAPRVDKVSKPQHVVLDESWTRKGRITHVHTQDHNGPTTDEKDTAKAIHRLIKNGFDAEQILSAIIKGVIPNLEYRGT